MRAASDGTSSGNQGDAVRADLGSGNPSRRKVVAGAAWAVPVLALTVATPAQAASPCALYPGNVVFSGPDANYGRQSPDYGQASVNLVGAPVGTHPPISLVINSYMGGYVWRDSDSLTGVDGKLLVTHTLWGNGGGMWGGWQTVRFTFDREVSNFTFTIGGIDSAGGPDGYTDRFYVEDLAKPVVSVGGTDPDGSQTSTWTYGAPVDIVTITFYSDYENTEDAPQKFHIRDVSFDAGCGIGSS